MNQITFSEPAELWEEALPIGNGRLGGMVFGRIKQDHFQLNEDSIWYGGYRDRVNPDAKRKLEEIRGLIFDGRIQEAERLMEASLSGVPNSQHPYQTAGELYVNWDLNEDFSQYRRMLDLDRGIVKVELIGENTSQTREYLASYEDQVIVIRVTSPKEDISFSMHLERSRFYEKAGRLSDDTIFIEGDLGKGGSDFIIAAKTEIKGGMMEILGEQLRVRAAKEAVIILAIETSFYHKEQWREAAKWRLEQAAESGYEAIFKRHIQDYQKLAGKVSLKLCDSCETDGRLLLRAVKEATKEEIKDETKEATKIAAKEVINNEAKEEIEKETRNQNRILQLRMTELYFQYGRYLLISSSRPGSQPANLQGIWNDSLQPCWDSKYTININTEMNYWPVEPCGLSQCHLPLFELLKRMHEKGKKVAEEMYGCRGFVAHHNTDLWGDCVPQDIYIPASYWVMGGAWLCTHIWTHYLYTKDEAFLREMYPILKDAVLFFTDFLVERGEYYVTCPSVSPENTYILQNGVKGSVCAGPSMDTQILRDLIEIYRKSSAILGENDDLLLKAEEIGKRLPPIQIGSHGQIMEWLEDYEEEEPGHRHISQLYALHPSHQITVDKTPGLARAAERTLERRLRYGGGHTGWSCAWIINMYARLGKGNKAWEYLNKLWRDSTFPNFMDNHPMGSGAVFQIDGNFGAVAAISELLVQADEDRILLLPALPDAWSEGEVNGLCIPGGGTISIRWQDGHLVRCNIQCEGEINTRISYQGKSLSVELGKGDKIAIVYRDFS